MARKQIDWEAVELRFRAGTESLRSIASAFDITEGAIRQRAKKEDWSRDLQARVRQATDAALLRKAATHDVRTEREAVAVEAEMRSDVVLRHRQDIVRGRRLFSALMTELEEAGAEGEAIAELFEKVNADTDMKIIGKARAALDKVLSNPVRIDSAKRLVETLEKLVRLERQAFGMGNDEADETALSPDAGLGRTLSDAERAVRLARLLATGSTEVQA